MKRNAIARIIVYSLLALVLAGILITGLLANIFSFDMSGNDGIAVNYEASVEAVSGIKLEINWAAGHVTVKREDVDRIYFREIAEEGIKRPMTYSFVGDTLELNHSNVSLSFGIHNPQEKDLVIVVPMDWSCGSLSIDGADLVIDIIDLTVRELDIDGAGTYLNFIGSVEQVEVDGAGCETRLTCRTKPQSISMDGAECVLQMTLPEDCGFRLEMDGLGCKLETDLPFQKQDGAYLSGNGHCKIEVDGLGCEVNIQASASVPMGYSLSLGDDFTEGLLLEAPDAEYAPGTVITLKTDVLTDVDLELYVNGKYVCSQTEYRSPDGTNHWEFQFTMPDEPVVIHFKTADSIAR